VQSTAQSCVISANHTTIHYQECKAHHKSAKHTTIHYQESRVNSTVGLGRTTNKSIQLNTSLTSSQNQCAQMLTSRSAPNTTVNAMSIIRNACGTVPYGYCVIVSLFHQYCSKNTTLCRLSEMHAGRSRTGTVL